MDVGLLLFAEVTVADELDLERREEEDDARLDELMYEDEGYGWKREEEEEDEGRLFSDSRNLEEDDREEEEAPEVRVEIRS